MASFGTFSGGGLGMGLAFTLKDNFSQTAAKIQRSFGGLEMATEKAQRKINAGLAKITSGATMLAGGALLAAPFVKGVSTAIAYEKQLSKVGAKMSATGAEMEALKQQTFALGEATQFSAQQVAEGQEFLAMAGFSANQTIQAMPGLLNLAAAGNLELARASDIASDTLTMFGMNASESNRVADVLAKTVNMANTDMEQFFDAMRYIGPTAAGNLNMSLEETSALIAVMSNAGLKGSLGTRALGTSFARLAKPTREMTNAMAEINFDAFNAEGNFVGVANMIDQLNTGMKGMTNEQRTRIISSIFGNEAIQEVNVLLNSQKEIIKDGQTEILKGAEAFKYFADENRNAAGSAEEMARRMLDNLGGDLTLLGSVIETTFIKIGAAITPVLRPIVQAFTIFVGLVGAFIDTPIGKVLMALTATLAAFLIVMGSVTIAMGAANMANGLLVKGLINLGQRSVAASVAQGNLRIALMKVGVQARATAFILRTRLMSAFTAFNASVTPSMGGVVRSIKKVPKALMGIPMAMKGGVVQAFGLLRGFFVSVIPLAYSFGTALGSILATMAPFIVIAAAVAGAIWLIHEAATTGVDNFVKMQNAADPSGIYDKLSPLERLLTRLGGLFTMIGEIWDTFVLTGDNQGDFFLSEGTFMALKSMGISEDTIESIGTWVGRAKALFTGFMDGLAEFWNGITTIFSVLGDAASSAFGVLNDMLEAVGINFGVLGGDLGGWIKAGKILAYVVGGILVVAFVAMAAAALSAAIGTLTAFAPVLLLIGGIILAVYLLMKAWTAVKGVAIAVADVFVALWGSMSGFFDQAVNWFSGLSDQATNWGSSMISRMLEGMRAAWVKVQEWITSAVGNLPFAEQLGLSGEVTTSTGERELGRRSDQLAETQALRVSAGSPIVNNVTTEKQVATNVLVTLDGDPIYENMANRADNENNRY